MTPQIDGAFAALEKQRSELYARLDGVSQEQLSFKPGPANWCILEVMHHLILSERGTYQYMVKKNRAERLPNIPVISSLRFSLLYLLFTLPIKLKIPTEFVRPAADKTFNQLKLEWEETREKLRDFIEHLPPERLQAAIYRHPVVGLLTVYHALKFINTHFKHHLKQIKRLQKEKEFLSGGNR